MFKKLLFACLSITSVCSIKASAQSQLVHYWHFNNDTAYVGYTDSTPVIRGIAADFSAIDTSKAKILYSKLATTSSAYHSYIDKYLTTSADNDTFNARMGAGPGRALRPRNPSDSMQLLFYIPTTHYKNIVLKFAVERSNNGPQQELYDYSVDSGATWRTTGITVLSDTPSTGVFKLETETFTDTMANNNSKLVFRIRFAGMSSGSSGNNRLDNITVEGDTIATGGSGSTGVVSTPLVPEFSLFPNPAQHRFTVIAGNGAVLARIMVYDMHGRKVLESAIGADAVNIDELESGIYMVDIVDEEGNTSVQKLVKQ